MWPAVIRAHVMAELPFMATENILMQCVKAGGDRQDLHEAIRVHSLEAAKKIKEMGEANDLLFRIAQDPIFSAIHDKLDEFVDPKLFIGRAAEQTLEFLEEHIEPILAKHAEELNELVNTSYELKV